MSTHLEPDSTEPKLTPREHDLVRAILDGLSNKEIAARLGISVQTVKNGLGPVFDKYRVARRLELAIRAGQALPNGSDGGGVLHVDAAREQRQR